MCSSGIRGHRLDTEVARTDYEEGLGQITDRRSPTERACGQVNQKKARATFVTRACISDNFFLFRRDLTQP